MLETGSIAQDRYRVVKPLGQGGMGAVFRAWDLRLKVPVALKELRPQPGLDAPLLGALREQFEQEASVLARLNHPNLVRVTDFFEEENNAYLVMDFVEGQSLAALIVQEGAQPENRVLDWGRQLLEALIYCHDRGVVHRDIKPQNIILKPDGGVMLVDFGLVKLWDPNDPRTRTAMRGMGTPEYAPPEQYGATGEHTGPPSDVYSLGATLYHLLTGKAPPTATDRMAMPEQFAPLRRLAPHVTPRTEQLVMKALSLSVNERWQNGREMLAALQSGPLPERPIEVGMPRTVRAGQAPVTLGTGGGRDRTTMAPHYPASTGGPPAGGPPSGPPAAGAYAGGTQKRKLSRGALIGLIAVALLCIGVACAVSIIGLPTIQAWLSPTDEVATQTAEVPTRTATREEPATATRPPEDDIPTATNTSPPQAGGLNVTIVNHSPAEVCYVMISPADSDSWGEDRLSADETILSGQTRQFTVDAGSYDIMVQNCNEVPLATAWQVNTDTTVAVGAPGASVGLEVLNRATVDICYVYISPTTADSWGADWMGDLEMLAAGSSRIFFVSPGEYDLQVKDCDNNVLTEEYQVDLTADLQWTLRD